MADKLRDRILFHTGGCISRTSNGDLYVTGAGLERTLLHSTDGGSTWKSKSYSIENMRFLSAFTILRDDTFVIVFMPPGKHRVFIALSRDLGRTWSVTKPGGFNARAATIVGLEDC